VKTNSKNNYYKYMKNSKILMECGNNKDETTQFINYKLEKYNISYYIHCWYSHTMKIKIKDYIKLESLSYDLRNCDCWG